MTQSTGNSVVPVSPRNTWCRPDRHFHRQHQHHRHWPPIADTAAGLPSCRNGSVTETRLDVNGFPWDERIHSSNHRKDSKGGWWAKRNVDPALKARVEAELRSTVGAAPVTTAPVIAPAAVIAPPALPGAGLPPMPGAALPDPAYAALVALIAQNTNSVANPAGRLTDDWVKQVLTHFGVAEGNLQNLAHAPQLVPQISDTSAASWQADRGPR